MAPAAGSSSTTPRRHRRPTLARSLTLLSLFRVEQSDPDRFYRALAQDSAAQLSQYADLGGAALLDVGGGPGYFRDAFAAAGATYWALDADVGELSGTGEIAPGTVLGSGLALPFRDASIDVCYSSNVLEHVAEPWRLTEEMLRVTKPGGTVFVSYMLWWGPHGGHETSPWHYLGGTRARRLYRRRHHREPKNRFGESLFALGAGPGLAWARRVEAEGRAEVLATFPRYHPWWAWWVLRVPVLREVLAWNLVIVLKRR